MPEPLEVIVGQLLLKHKLTLALAESCTGGLVGHRMTNVPGSSEYLLGGIVAYSYDAKEHLLGVRHNTLIRSRRGERRNGDRDGARGTAHAGRRYRHQCDRHRRAGRRLAGQTGRVGVHLPIGTRLRASGEIRVG